MFRYLLASLIFLGAALPAAPPRLFYWHLNMSYINDFQNGNLFLNMDDRYTFGTTVRVALNNWETFFHYRSLTDRYLSKTRIDELQVGLRYTLGNLLSSRFWRHRPSHYNRRPEARRREPLYLGVTFAGSYFQAGQILGQTIQNFFHRLTRVPRVHNRYLANKYTVGLGLNVYFSYTTRFMPSPSWQHSFLELGLRAHTETAVGYQGTLRLGLRSKFYSGNQYLQWDLYLQKLGYYQNVAGTVEGLWSDTSSALWLAFSSRAGLYQRRVDVSFGNAPDSAYPFGFGSLELSWAYLPGKRDFVEADYSHSLLTGTNGLSLDRFAFLFRLAKRIPSDFSFMVARGHHGDPRLFGGNSLTRKIESLWLAMFHFRPTLDLKKLGFLEFYAGLGTGLLIIESMKKLGQIFPFRYFAIAGQAGLRWYGLALRRDAAVYGIELAVLSFLTFAGQENGVRIERTGTLVSHLQPRLYFMLGITVLTDW